MIRNEEIKIQYSLQNSYRGSFFIKLKEAGNRKGIRRRTEYVYESIWCFDKEIEAGNDEYHFLVKNVAGKIVKEEMSRHLLSTYSSLDSYCILTCGKIKTL